MEAEFNLSRAIVHNEGCDIHYWYTGQGPLITFVPGANGHGMQFYKLMAALSSKYTCVTFDRRQMSESKVPINKCLNPPQQARDILAVIKIMGFEKSIVFGSSLGGVLSFVLAHDHPEVIEHLISHEAPTAYLLPDASELYEYFLGLLELRDAKGWEASAAEFAEIFIAYDDPDIPPRHRPVPENPKNFWENEMRIATAYSVNLNRIKESGVSVGLMTGKRSKDAFYARATYEQEKIMGCPRFNVAGHHQGFECETEAFLPDFHRMLETLDSKKYGTARQPL